MSANVNVTRSSSKEVLMVVANPSVSTTTGWPVGFWASELTHPWYEFREVGYEVTLASPDGGKVEVDAMGDPRDPSGYSADDVISMGFLNTPKLVAMLEDTKKLSDLNLEEFDAIVVCGGQSPMFTFRDNEELKEALSHFYESEKTTAALCHGTTALMDVNLSDGSYLIEGKTMTDFADIEEEAADAAAGHGNRLRESLAAKLLLLPNGGHFADFDGCADLPQLTQELLSQLQGNSVPEAQPRRKS